MTIKDVTHTTGTGETIAYLRLTADDGKALTNDGGATLWNCVDVVSADGWVEVSRPPAPEEEATVEDYEAALEVFGV